MGFRQGVMCSIPSTSRISLLLQPRNPVMVVPCFSPILRVFPAPAPSPVTGTHWAGLSPGSIAREGTSPSPHPHCETLGVGLCCGPVPRTLIRTLQVSQTPIYRAGDQAQGDSLKTEGLSKPDSTQPHPEVFSNLIGASGQFCESGSCRSFAPFLPASLHFPHFGECHHQLPSC